MTSLRDNRLKLPQDKIKVQRYFTSEIGYEYDYSLRGQLGTGLSAGCALWREINPWRGLIAICCGARLARTDEGSLGISGHAPYITGLITRELVQSGTQEEEVSSSAEILASEN